MPTRAPVAGVIGPTIRARDGLLCISSAATTRPMPWDVVIWRTALASAAAVAVVSGVTACGPNDASRQIAALSSAERVAPQTCAKADAPIGFTGAIWPRQ